MIKLEVQEGEPPLSGLYVAYVESKVTNRWAEKLLLAWREGRWSYPLSDQYYRAHVYGWIGPLPAMELTP